MYYLATSFKKVSVKFENVLSCLVQCLFKEEQQGKGITKLFIPKIFYIGRKLCPYAKLNHQSSSATIAYTNKTKESDEES